MKTNELDTLYKKEIKEIHKNVLISLTDIKYGVVFKTSNLFNGKLYIGQSTRIKEVINQKYKGSGKLFINSLKKYKQKSFKTTILDYCIDQEELDEREKFWIKEFKSTDKELGYNLKKGGNGGGRHSDETKKKLSIMCMGRKVSPKTLEKIRLANKGKKRSKEFIENNRIKQTGKIRSLETKKRISESKKGKKCGVENHFYGKTHSIETKERLAKLNTGKTHSDYTKKKISDLFKGEKHPLYGKPCSEERKKKASESMKNKEPLKCPFCDMVSTSRSNLKRYHFENCKFKTKVLLLNNQFN